MEIEYSTLQTIPIIPFQRLPGTAKGDVIELSDVDVNEIRIFLGQISLNPGSIGGIAPCLRDMRSAFAENLSHHGIAGSLLSLHKQSR